MVNQNIKVARAGNCNFLSHSVQLSRWIFFRVSLGIPYSISNLHLHEPFHCANCQAYYNTEQIVHSHPSHSACMCDCRIVKRKFSFIPLLIFTCALWEVKSLCLSWLLRQDVSSPSQSHNLLSFDSNLNVIKNCSGMFVCLMRYDIGMICNWVLNFTSILLLRKKPTYEIL